MPLNPRTSLRMPPDGAGKALAVDFYLHVDYIALAGDDPQIGDEVIGQTSSTSGVIIASQKTTATSGSINITFPRQTTEDLLASFTDGETLSIREGAITVQAQTQYIINVNTTQLVGRNNPTYGQYVDEKGSAFVRYAEGDVQFDAFGYMRTSNLNSIGLYSPRYDELPFSMSTVQSGGGTFSYNSAIGSVLLTCGIASGDYISRRSNKYHQYQPGIGHLILMTVSAGDTGKAGVIRRWGYFDDNNGVFFELAGTQLNVVLRKNIGNGVEEERVDQQNWEGDKLDGTGLSQMVIDVSKNNIWWIDLAYLGAGRVRTGVFAPDGSRVTAHIFENTNENPYSYMRTGSLPVNIEQQNTGITGSSSQMNFQLAAVYAENSVPRNFNSFGRTIPEKAITGATPKHMVSIRPQDTYKGLDNRTVILPYGIDIFGVNAAGEIRPVRIYLSFSSTLTTPTWVPHADLSSGVEFCTNAVDDIGSGDRVVYTGVAHSGRTIDLEKLFPYEGSAILTKWADGSRPWASLFVAPAIPTDSLTLYGDMTWREYE